MVSMVVIKYCLAFKYLRRNMITQLLNTYCGRIQWSAWCIPRGKQMFHDALSGKLGTSWWKQNLRTHEILSTLYVINCAHILVLHR